MTEEKNTNQKTVAAITWLIVWWFILFVAGVAGIVLVRAWMWVWKVTEF